MLAIAAGRLYIIGPAALHGLKYLIHFLYKKRNIAVVINHDNLA
jgi:hypothetical protein